MSNEKLDRLEESRLMKIQDGHLMIYYDPNRPGGGFWIHSCESEGQCGNYAAKRTNSVNHIFPRKS